MTMQDLHKLASRGYGNSVVRRTLLLLCLMGPAFATNLLLYYLAAELLAPESFGLFYVAITISNVLYSGSFVLNIFFTRHLTFLVNTASASAAYAARRPIRLLVIRYGALAALACILVLYGLGQELGVQSWPIIILIVLDAYSAYVLDVDRAVLQSLRKTVYLGGLSLTWMLLRFVLGVGGMVLLGTAVGALLGVVLASFVLIACLALMFSAADAKSATVLPPLPSLRALVPVVLGYASLIVVSNMDVLLAYLLLKDSTLGVYSASSVLPKGILVVVTPLLQMLYPMMVWHDRAPANVRLIVQKSAGTIFLLSSAMALAVFAFSGLLCGGSWGLRLCQPFPLHDLLVATVMLSVLRALVLIQSARGRDWMALSLLLPAGAYFWIAAISNRNVDTVAREFMTFTGALLLYFVVMSLLADYYGRRVRLT
jgi:O-antigen/teichoic acid export membrane protein